jgi:hypothetical protein
VKIKLFSLAVGLCVFLGLGGLGQRAFAGTTTLTFDEFSNSTVLTTQYQSLGVTISGAVVFTSCPSCVFPPVSGTNVAYAPTGLMTLTFNSAVVGGNVQTVSAYVTDPNGPAGIYAYDSSNNLLGQSLLPADGGVNVLLSVTSSGAPIAYVTVHDGGGSFTIDNFSFTWTASSAKLKADAAINASNSGGFLVGGTLTLGPSSTIDPVTEPVILRVGTFTLTIPAGSFGRNRAGWFAFEGFVGHADVAFTIIPLGHNEYLIGADVTGANLTGTVNPVTVALSIGDQSATTTITAEIY